MSREVLGYAFEGRFDCDFAVNGAEAIELIGRNTYACVFLDLVMPVADGFAVLDYLKGREDPAGNPPVIVLTSASEAGQREKCLAAGASDFLTKPFKIAAVEAAFERIGGLRS